VIPFTVYIPLPSIQNVQWEPRSQNLSLAGVQGSVCHTCIDLDAGVWILDPRSTCLNWTAQRNFHSSYICLRFVYLRLFQGLRLATFLWVARGADLATVTPRVKEAEWLLTIGTQDEIAKLPTKWKFEMWIDFSWNQKCDIFVLDCCT
jgi:hypothetical protein